MAWLTPDKTRAVFPVTSGFITARYGQPRPPKAPHKGTDIAAPEGSPVLAILPGIVAATYPSGQATGYGNLIVIRHGQDAYSLYAHLRAVFVAPGQSVTAGQPIGSVGTTAGTQADPDAQTSGPHLHLETLTAWPPASRYADRVDPEKVLAAIFPGRGTEPPDSFTISPYRSLKRASPIGLFFALIAAVWLTKKKGLGSRTT